MDQPKILIVDDDPDLRRALTIRLQANHYSTVHASDGYAAISVAQRERPDLIILDLGLPAGDGFVVMDRLRDSDILSSIGDRLERPRSSSQRTTNPASGRNCLFPEACGQ
jgi:CheY-like chemotaxis protein